MPLTLWQRSRAADAMRDGISHETFATGGSPARPGPAVARWQPSGAPTAQRTKHSRQAAQAQRPPLTVKASPHGGQPGGAALKGPSKARRRGGQCQTLAAARKRLDRPRKAAGDPVGAEHAAAFGGFGQFLSFLTAIRTAPPQPTPSRGPPTVAHWPMARWSTVGGPGPGACFGFETGKGGGVTTHRLMHGLKHGHRLANALSPSGRFDGLENGGIRNS